MLFKPLLLLAVEVGKSHLFVTKETEFCDIANIWVRKDATRVRNGLSSS